MTHSLTHGYATSITLGNFCCSGFVGAISSMQTAFDTRRDRLLMLKQKYGTWAAMNKVLGWETTNARLSQIGAKSIRSGRDTPYVMGDEMAREIETAFGLETGWMDTPPSPAELSGKADPIALAMNLLQAMEPEARYQAVRLLGALAQPVKANGTSGHN